MGLFPIGDPKHEAIYAEEAAMVDASERIAEALEASGITRAELARLLNVTRSEITDRLRGDRNITVRNLAATLHALGARLELHADIPTPHAAEEPVDIAAYRKWAPSNTHADHSRADYALRGSYASRGGYAMNGRS